MDVQSLYKADIDKAVFILKTYGATSIYLENKDVATISSKSIDLNFIVSGISPTNSLEALSDLMFACTNEVMLKSLDEGDAVMQEFLQKRDKFIKQ